MSFSVLSISLSGSTATVTTPSPHGLSNGDTIGIVGADQSEYNIVAIISGVTATTWNYTIVGTPDSATGTIIAYEVSGEPSTSDVFSLGLTSGDGSISEGFSLGLTSSDGSISELFSVGTSDGDGSTSEYFSVGTSDGDGSQSESFSLGVLNGDGSMSESFTLGPSAGESAISEDFEIPTVVPLSIAEFIGTPLVGFSPLVVNFTDLSSGTIDSYLWDFGDPASGASNTSTLQNPSHSYEFDGDFTVTLTTTNTSGDSVEVKTDYVDIISVPDLLADFITVKISTNPGGIQVDFSNQSITPTIGTTYFWEFGDGDTSTNENPSHVYTDPGAYQVTLTVNVGPFSSQTCKNVIVTLEIPRFMEIWGTAALVEGVPIEADRQIISAFNEGKICEETHTDTFRTYRTVDDAGTIRFIVRARGNTIGIDNSGFADGELVRLFFGERLAVDSNGDPIEIPFYQTLPSTPQSHTELDLVFPLPVTTPIPVGGTFSNRTTVELLSNVIPATIYYTLDGTDPTTSGTRIEYTSPFELIEGTTTVKFFTADPLGPDEEVKTEIYIVEEPKVTPSVPASDYSSNQEVTLIGSRPGTIEFSINGGPFEIYDGLPIAVEAGPSGFGTTIIQAFLDDTINVIIGPTDTFTYSIDLVRPVITSFTVNNGDEITTSQLITVQVDASSFTNSVPGLLLSEVPDFTGATVQLYAPEVTFLFSPGDGPKELYAQVTDQLEQFSTVKMTSIVMSTEVPTMTVSTGPSAPIGDTFYVFTGTKSAESGVLMRTTVNGNIGDEALVIPIDSDTEWEYAVALREGTNEIKFQTITIAQNRSIEEVRTIEVKLLTEGLKTATTITNPEGVWRVPFVLFDEKISSNTFALLVEASFGADPVVLFPIEDAIINERVITVSGTADPGSTITLRVVEA